jgi:hypothetical protein
MSQLCVVPLRPPPTYSSLIISKAQLFQLTPQKARCPTTLTTTTIDSNFDQEYAVSTNQYFTDHTWSYEEKHIMQSVAFFVRSVDNRSVALPNGGGVQRVTNAIVTNYQGIETQVYAWEEAEGRLNKIKPNNIVLFRNLVVSKPASISIGTLDYQLRFNAGSDYKYIVSEIIQPPPTTTQQINQQAPPLTSHNFIQLPEQQIKTTNQPSAIINTTSSSAQLITTTTTSITTPTTTTTATEYEAPPLPPKPKRRRTQPTGGNNL